MVSILGQTPENVRQLMFEAPSDYGVDTSKQCSECADYDSNGLPEFQVVHILCLSCVLRRRMDHAESEQRRVREGRLVHDAETDENPRGVWTLKELELIG